jgi:hypothetical protein
VEIAFRNARSTYTDILNIKISLEFLRYGDGRFDLSSGGSVRYQSVSMQDECDRCPRFDGRISSELICKRGRQGPINAKSVTGNLYFQRQFLINPSD